MSQVYSTEPQTTGRVVLQTSHGPIDVNLWCKECPKACRSFLQLSADGYYDGLPFHRVIKNYLLQTGDRASSLGEDPSVRSKVSSYLHHVCHKIHETKGLTPSYRPELSSRIKFNHRGQVAMAHNISTNVAELDEGSSHLDGHFFITLDEASHLNGQHVIFGTVTGPTIFNAIRASGVELVEGEDTPVDAATACFIERIEIKDHPFGDQIQPTRRGFLPWVEPKERLKKETTQENILAKRKKARQGKRDLNVLSFGHEEDDSSSIHIHNERKSFFDVLQPSTTRRDAEKEEQVVTLSHDYTEEENGAVGNASDKDQKTTTNGSADLSSQAKGNAEAQVYKIVPTQQRTLNPQNQEFNTWITEEQRNRRPKKSAVEERREKYKRLQKVAVDKKGKRLREENTMQRLLDFKCKLKTEAKQVRLQETYLVLMTKYMLLFYRDVNSLLSSLSLLFPIVTQKAFHVTEYQNLSENEATGEDNVLLDILTADDYVVIDSAVDANRKM